MSKPGHANRVVFGWMESRRFHLAGIKPGHPHPFLALRRRSALRTRLTQGSRVSRPASPVV
jgi:hypothetical protein